MKVHVTAVPNKNIWGQAYLSAGFRVFHVPRSSVGLVERPSVTTDIMVFLFSKNHTEHLLPPQ
jgi:hypothetical protein